MVSRSENDKIMELAKDITVAMVQNNDIQATSLTGQSVADFYREVYNELYTIANK